MPVIKQEGLHDPDHFTMRIAETGKITFADQRIVELLDQRTEDLQNKYLWQCVHSADEPLVNEAFRQLMSSSDGQEHALKVILFKVILRIY